jgi:carbon monoxide dehydrogenase subunit G
MWQLPGGAYSMQLSDSRMIAASPDRVWAALFDPEVLKTCIPGCQSMTGSLAEGYEAVVVQKVGPVSAKFTGIVSLSDVVEGQAVTISGEGKGGPAGFAKGGARVTLAAEGAGTMLSYQVDANVGGKIAQLGSRIIDGFAKKLADQFFENFAGVVEPPAEPEPAEAEAEGEDAPKKGWFKRLIG